MKSKWKPVLMWGAELSMSESAAGGSSLAEWRGSGQHKVMLLIWKSAACPGVKLRYRLAHGVKSYHASTKPASEYWAHTHTYTPLRSQKACIFHEESKNKYFIQVFNVNSIMHLFFDLLSFEVVWMQRWWNDSRASNPHPLPPSLCNENTKHHVTLFWQKCGRTTAWK